MKFFRFILLVAAILTISPHHLFASGGGSSPFFDPPPYIDLEYSAPSAEYYPITIYDVLDEYAGDKNQPTLSENKNIKALIENSKNSKEYKLYQQGAEKFNNASYVGDYVEALKIFKSLSEPSSPFVEKVSKWIGKDTYSWPKEAATYMVGRTQAIIAQNNWDGYDDPVKIVDQAMIKEADQSYQTYLRLYPDGLYANSAKNMNRRLLFLSGKDDELQTVLKEAVNKNISDGSSFDADLFVEFLRFNKQGIDTKKDALLIILSRWMKETKATADDIRNIEERENEFKTDKNLFKYVRALGLYQLGEYQKLVDKTPEEKIEKNVISMSTALLRARALKEIKNYQEALKVLTELRMISESAISDLEIARLKNETQDTLWIYSNSSPIKNEDVLRSVAQNALEDSQLEQGIQDKDLSKEGRQFLLDELMLRYLLGQNYSKLNGLFEKEKSIGVFSALKPSIKALSVNKNDANALLVVAKFIYYKGINPEYTFREGYYYVSPSLEQFTEWCKECKKTESRQESYAPPISIFSSILDGNPKDKRVTPEALHYLVRCFRGGEYRSKCQWHNAWTDKFENKSKDWFKNLHKNYPNSIWAEKTPY